MADLNVIKELAEQSLIIPTLKGTPDRYLIDRSYRVLRHCGGIAELHDVRCFQIDLECLNVAALFRDTGFARYANQEDKASRMVLADLTDEDLRDFSAQIVQEKLADLLNPRQLERVCSIIIESGKRDTVLAESMILSDARNLDDMGAVGIFNEVRRYLVHGRGVSEAVTSWNRKLEYDYWSARLRESFRFAGVRDIARQRLQIAEQFMRQLDAENRAGDLERILMEQSCSEQPVPSRIQEYSPVVTRRPQPQYE
jgi:hypothetical protein